VRRAITDGRFTIEANMIRGDEPILYLRKGSDRAAYVDLLRIE
jgi:hypothetical protein